MAGLVGIAALARLLAGRKAAPVPPALPPPAPETDPAVELRQKLAASRDDGPADETLAGVARGSACPRAREGAGGDGRDGRPPGAAVVSEEHADDVAGTLARLEEQVTQLHREVQRIGVAG